MLRTSQIISLGLLLAVGTPAASAQAIRDGSHDFDREFGVWNVRVEQLAGDSRTWVSYTGTHVVRPLWNGRANIGVLEIRGSAGRIEGLQLRLYDPRTHLWKLSFASSSDGELQAPAVGSFHDGVGDFRDSMSIDGRTVLERALSTTLTSNSYKDVISRSYDGGETWKPVWIAVYRKQHER